MIQKVKFDVMLNGMWKGTFTMPIGKYFHGISDGKPLYNIPSEVFKDFIEERRPSLKGKPYSIAFVDKEIKDLWKQ